MRAAEWTDGARTPIGYDEWRALVADDPEMAMRGRVEAATGAGEKLRYENERLAIRIGHPYHKVPIRPARRQRIRQKPGRAHPRKDAEHRPRPKREGAGQ